MPRLGLRFSRLEVIPAAGRGSTVDTAPFAQAGCSVNLNACVSVMKSPIGNDDFCEAEVGKRVDAAVKIVGAISRLPDKRCALHLLRYQAGRMEYTTRAT
eukprot:3445606-Karenia_brevis.AAC.1